MIFINGISWIIKNNAGTVFKKYKTYFDNSKVLHNILFENSIVNNKIKNFGRFNITAQNYCNSVAMAFHDAGISRNSNDKKIDISVIGSGNNGATEDNLAYFKDYVESGRNIARGNLFVYTLPTSPLGEVAIAYKLKGQIQYIGLYKNIISNTLKLVNNMFAANTGKGIIVIITDKTGLLTLFIQNKKISHSILFDKFMSDLSVKEYTVYELVSEFFN